jgi:hypothetical protein
MTAKTYGLRPTLRHLLILNAYFAILLAILLPVSRLPVALPGVWAMLFPYSLALPVSPLIVTVLVMLFEQPGPAKKWLVALSSRLVLPSLALWLDLLIAVQMATGVYRFKAGPFLIVLLLNAFLVMFALVQLPPLIPSKCPRCGTRTLLPVRIYLRSLQGQHEARWCARCGRTFRGDEEVEPRASLG